MQQSSDGRLRRMLDKICQLEKIVFQYKFYLQNNSFQKNYLETSYFTRIQQIIENYQNELNNINMETISKAESQNIYYDNYFNDQSKHLSEFLNDKIESFNFLQEKIQSQLSDYNIIAKQCCHNVETAINAFNIQIKDTQESTYNEIKKLDLLLAQKKREYSQNSENKINQLQERSNKTVKCLTEFHLNTQSNVHKEFIKSLFDDEKSPLKRQKIKSIQNKIKLFKQNISQMKQTVAQLIDAQHNHSERMISQSHEVFEGIANKIEAAEKICEEIEKDRSIDIQFAVKNSDIFIQFDAKLNEIMSDIKENNRKSINAKVDEINGLQNIFVDTQKENENKIQEKKESICLKIQAEDEKMKGMQNAYEDEISTIQTEKSNEKSFYQDKFDILFNKIKAIKDELAKIENIESSSNKFDIDNDDEITNLRKTFDDEIHDENDIFEKKCQELKKQEVEIEREIYEAELILSEYKKELLSLSNNALDKKQSENLENESQKDKEENTNSNTINDEKETIKDEKLGENKIDDENNEIKVNKNNFDDNKEEINEEEAIIENNTEKKTNENAKNKDDTEDEIDKNNKEETEINDNADKTKEEQTNGVLEDDGTNNEEETKNLKILDVESNVSEKTNDGEVIFHEEETGEIVQKEEETNKSNSNEALETEDDVTKEEQTNDKVEKREANEFLDDKTQGEEQYETEEEGGKSIHESKSDITETEINSEGETKLAVDESEQTKEIRNDDEIEKDDLNKENERTELNADEQKAINRKQNERESNNIEKDDIQLKENEQNELIEEEEYAISEKEREEIIEFKKMSKIEIKELRQKQDQEFENEIRRNAKKITELIAIYKTDEDNFISQSERNYQQSISNVKLILSSNKTEISTKEKEYINELKSDEDKLKEIENDPSFKQSVYYSSQNSGKDELIESLKHKCFQLKKDVVFQRISYESELKDKLEFEEKSMSDQIESLPTEFKEFLIIQKEMKQTKQSRFEMEGELNEKLEKLKLKGKEILNEIDYDQRMKDASQDDKITELSTRLNTLKQETEIKTHQKENFYDQQISHLIENINERISYYESERETIAKSIEKFQAENNEISKNKDERSTSIQANIQQKIQEENDDFLLKKCNQKLSFEESKTKISSEIAFYEKGIKDEEMKHFMNFNQCLSKMNVSIDDLSRSNRNELNELKYKMKGLKEFANEQIKVAEEKLIQMKKLFESNAARDADMIAIRKLEKRVCAYNHRLSTLLAKYNEAKALFEKKEKEYNRRFGLRPDIGILRGKPLLVKNSFC